MSRNSLSKNPSKEFKALFTLDQTDDFIFRNRFQVTLPKWTLEDVDLFRWIIGFGHNVKVINPPELVTKVQETAKNISNIYQSQHNLQTLILDQRAIELAMSVF